MAKVKIDVLESQCKIGGKHYHALGIDDNRRGPDAGPWTTLHTFTVDADDLIRIAEEAKEKEGG